MSQAEMFEGKKLKSAGMKLAAENRATELHNAQIAARFVGRNKPDGIVTIEDIRYLYHTAGRIWNLGNAAGSVFSGPEWECVGYVPATHPAAHGRIVRQWRLRK